MGKKISEIVLGLFLIALGILLILDYNNVITISISFDGWWTVFIIVPCLLSMLNTGINLGNMFGVIIGFIFLFASQDIIGWDQVFNFIWPSLIILAGLHLIFMRKPFVRKKKVKESDSFLECNAIFSGSNHKYQEEIFEGARLTAIFGGIELDLRDAIIKDDVVIDITAICGGVDLLVSKDVNVKTNGTNLLGGIGNKASSNNKDAKTIYINSTCILGGMEIK